MNERLDSIKADIVTAQRAGDHLKEYDLAQAALELYPQEEYFRYCSVLALSRCNAKQRALDIFYSYHLHESEDEYVRALEARILKDLAFQSITDVATLEGMDRGLLHTAALTYLREFERTGSQYSAVNAATLYLLAGERELSRYLAEKMLNLPSPESELPYFVHTNQAIACLLLQRTEDAVARLALAAVYNEGNLQVRARTYFQMELLCRYLHLDRNLLAPLLPETVIHYCGHAFYNHHPISEVDERELARRIEQVVAEKHCAVAYGSLMAGSDILFAEAILKQGGELNVWLPFGLENFCKVAVEPAGAHWVRRFHNCINAASTVSFVTQTDFLGDEVLFRLCSDVAMGMALMRSSNLHTKVMQLAVWNQDLQTASRGTYSNIQRWRALGQHAEIIPSPQVIARTKQQKSRTHYPAERREPKAFLFADVRGFSKLSDRDLLWYFNVLSPTLAKVIKEYQNEIEHVDTWGDAIFLVTGKAAVAANVAMEINAAIARLDQSELELGQPLLMRIGLHYGPAYRVYDHLAECYTYASNDVTKTARIEPVTPPGEVFGTEPFVAMLEMEGIDSISIEYAGTLSSAKDYGAFRMFHLRPENKDAALLCTLE